MSETDGHCGCWAGPAHLHEGHCCFAGGPEVEVCHQTTGLTAHYSTDQEGQALVQAIIDRKASK